MSPPANTAIPSNVIQSASVANKGSSPSVTNAVGQPNHDKVKNSLPLSSASHDGSQDLDTSSDEDDKNKENIPPGTHNGLHTATPTAGSKRKGTFQEVSIPKRLRSPSILGLRLRRGGDDLLNQPIL
ncbi:hypothetical protein BC939DRAFT_507483 [Gamsiella multidivaricata]|uniref:uncharacterized protein n=1 Tax=Gamsiella multidivaricata TaxID=101098 RepID=UPI0022203D2E|nr:uncharacterized protein BC939DRAFT_507483 [Gamsiella multidivaricata]KAI7817373.1 hypothetical protein BC939DRAFT_507483 [Gamsiella multidivaricata]